MASSSLSIPSLRRQTVAAVRLLLVLTLLLGVGYPAVVWAVGRVGLHDQATGSLVHHDGRVVGSSLLGQNFSGAAWFHGRASASSYAGNTSGGTNLPESDPQLWKAAAAMRKAAGSIGDRLPPDALTTSASGLDPDISPAYAELQAPQIAAARQLPVAQVRRLVAQHTTGRTLGYLGEPRVDVLELNLALQDLSAGAR
ncbi:potassium-transporting ATPase subunit KdpC [Allobranchiibius sp. GilTou73]|uniref:potassium-transporting ATPase subunit KdpC n=1 Tax=Allobranchiibius sp. GilTou73 TaxID=2904523 RepID=UPI001F3AA6D6|nr:potassium-transporting ATPase subunit KdpC [Allobranchiibius sp. GilTou73]UIJ34118.1 potassium-transporting ATPase subunit KdpC [Allobranchiibius sp. GilTou73]